MMNDVKCLLLLAKVYKSHKKEDVMGTLDKVIDNRQQTQALYLPFPDGSYKRKDRTAGLEVLRPGPQKRT